MYQFGLALQGLGSCLIVWSAYWTIMLKLFSGKEPLLLQWGGETFVRANILGGNFIAGGNIEAVFVLGLFLLLSGVNLLRSAARKNNEYE